MYEAERLRSRLRLRHSLNMAIDQTGKKLLIPFSKEDKYGGIAIFVRHAQRNLVLKGVYATVCQSN